MELREFWKFPLSCASIPLPIKRMHRILTFVGAAQLVRAGVSFDTWSEEEEVTGSKKKIACKNNTKWTQ